MSATDDHGWTVEKPPTFEEDGKISYVDEIIIRGPDGQRYQFYADDLDPIGDTPDDRESR